MLPYLAALGLAAGLALDTATVAAARALARRPSAALPWLFGAAHGVMATLGWAIGHSAASILAPWDRWLAGAIFALLGLQMIVFSRRDGEDEDAGADGGWALALLTVATSVDALAAGVAIDALGVPPPITIGLIAAVCVAFTMAASHAARRIAARWTDRFAYAGGAILIAVAIYTLRS